MNAQDSNRLAHVEQSRDPKWVRWSVSQTDVDTIWFYSKDTAENYAAAIRGGDVEKAAQIAFDYACQ